jgi:hypothetical protein
MSQILLVASERGLWRVPLDESLPASVEQLSVDVPAHSVSVLAGTQENLAALCSDGRLLVWDFAARAFREGPPLELDESEPECACMAEDGSLYLGGCPPRVWRWRPAEGWQEMASLSALSVSNRWQGLEAPYEPRVSGLWAENDRVWASISVGGLCCYQKDHWESYGAQELPRDQRDLLFISPRLYLATSQGLWVVETASGKTSRLSLPPRAAFAARLARGSGPAQGIVLAAAPGPPATWRGPDGSRMSLWHFAPDATVGRPLAGPFHGVIQGLMLQEDVVWAATDDGELWRIPLAGPAPEQALIADLPTPRALFLVDEAEARG